MDSSHVSEHPSVSNGSENIFDANDILQKEILQLQHQLKTLHMPDVHVETDLSKLNVEGEGNNEDDNDQRRDIQILRCSCKLLRAQLNSLRTGTTPYQPWTLGDKDVLNQLGEKLKQTEECSTLLDLQRKELLKDTEHEMKVALEVEELLKSAENKAKSQGKKKRQENSHEVLEKKCKHMAKVNAELEKKLVAFTSKYCPLPDEDTFKALKKKHKDVPVMRSRDELYSLNQIVEELVEAAVSDPNDPYIQKDHCHWPPYIEILQRMDLVEEHPDDTNRIKLMAVYL